MRKVFVVLAVCLFVIAGMLSAAEQNWAAKETLQLEAGKYKLNFREKVFWRISGFEYDGKELFINSYASAGTRYEIFPKDQKEQLNSVKLTVNGVMPPKVDKVMKGDKLVLEREARYGAITLFSRYELDAEKGLTWAFKYKVEDGAKPKYFWMFTMAWDNSFSDFRYANSKGIKGGTLVSDGKWKVNDNINALAMYSPKLQSLVLTKIVTPIPTEMRNFTIWDTKSYHKFYVQHKPTNWTLGYTSPEYVTSYAAYKVGEDQWTTVADDLLKGCKPNIAPVKAPAAEVAAKPDIMLDFEENAQYNVNEEHFEGKKCYKFQGKGNAETRSIPVNLKAKESYKVEMAMRKGTCTVNESKKICYAIGYYSGDKFKPFFKDGGSNIPGEDKWTASRTTINDPAEAKDCVIVLYNPSEVPLYIDSVKFTRLAPGSDAAKAAKEGLVTRPLPPITEEQAEKEDWLTNRRGIEALDDDFILPPFTPINYKNGIASVWGREYAFDDLGMLKGVKIFGNEFMAGPMSFKAKVNGEYVDFKLDRQVLLRERKGVVELFSRANSPNVDIEVRTTIEYDGMVKVDFTFDPRGTVEIEDFQYSIPLPEKNATFIHYTGAREGGLSLNVPRVSNTRRLPAGEGTVWKAPFKILVWLGGYEKGLLWFCESEQFWSPHARSQRKQGLSVERKGGLVTLNVQPVSEPRLFSRRTTYTFGLMATPVRPRQDGWRMADMNYDYRADTAEKQTGADTPVIYSSGSYDFRPPATDNPQRVGFYPRIFDVEAYKARLDNAHKKGRIFGLYIDPILCNLGIYKNMSQYKAVPWDPTTDNADTGAVKQEEPFLWQSPEVKKYYFEWRKEPLSTAPYGKHKGERQFQTGLGSRYQDFFCYLMETHAQYGCDGVANLDEWGPVPDANHKHDMGYYDRDGKRYPEYDWFARRALLKRMCHVFYKKHGRIPVMRVHMAATLVVPIASFCESIITGENINSAYFQKATLMDEYTVNAKEILASLENGGKDFTYYVSNPDRWAIEYGGQAFGWAGCIISNITKSPKIDSKYAASEEATRDYLAMCLTHDNILQPIFCNPNPAYRLMKIKQDFRIGDKEVRFFPYWGEQHPVTSDGRECYSVCWENKGKYLISVANLSLKNQDLNVKLDKAFFKKGKLVDAESGEAVQLNGNQFKVSIPRRNYKLYLAE